MTLDQRVRAALYITQTVQNVLRTHGESQWVQDNVQDAETELADLVGIEAVDEETRTKLEWCTYNLRNAVSHSTEALAKESISLCILSVQEISREINGGKNDEQ